MKKKPDLVVWDEVEGYNASKMQYPTNVSAPAFTLPDVGLVKTESAKKMMDVFEREKKELVEKVEKMYKEYLDSVMVWESKISFDPVVGKTYYLYNFKGINTLSLLSPDDWNKHDCFIGGFVLNSDRKWIRI